MFDIVIQQDSKQLLDLSSIISTIIGGGITLLGVGLTIFFNEKRTSKNKQEHEISTILSIVEELKNLQEAFGEEFDSYFADVSDTTYIEYPITITQDYTTIFTNNADHIGYIKNAILRNKIIKTYTLIKKIIDNFLHYNTQIEQLNIYRLSFIKSLYPELVIIKCAERDLKFEVENLKKTPETELFMLAQKAHLKKEQIINFLKSDTEQLASLIYWSNSMKGFYNEIIHLISEIVDLSDKIYKGK